ncbi:putative iron(III) dicitrate ABC transporter, ATP-binding protein FecE [Prevotella sp. DNF00663]|uniref:ABC transporter ATP-binding protein n=1 Tax=unclassified Prevotella TaxID=2638335 RepID=UPI00051465FB|nr:MULTISPECIES: ABC transporter ATP-binding protein [unclassified Prevotella]KGI60793.1 iron ABC transporter ATP-binding protein [Prevotella sp. S7 MS 2]KXB82584.1 putative iron(III) dicitrate ABC transporter, ATP-binding protein FecE [Prevotella sp. DNF00663]
MNETITLCGLAIGYRQGNNVKEVANNLTAALQAGELTCLLGANGVGKSTLLRTLAGFQPPLKGSIDICGKPLSSLSDAELSRLVSVVLTQKMTIQNITAREMVEMGRAPYTGFWGRLHSEDRQAVDEALTLVGMKHMSDRMIQTLSDGERQKIMIAKALAQQTPIVFLDEPTAFLDFPSKVDMMQLLRRLAAQHNKTIFLSTHDLELALQLSDRLWLLDSERKLHIGTSEQLAENGTLSRYVGKNGIEFDAETLAIHLQKDISASPHE